MWRHWLGGLACAAAVAGACVGQRTALTALLGEAERLGVRTGCVVCDLDGQVLFARRGAQACAPASNQKILTAAAALAGLGPHYEFQTELALEDGVVVVRGGGDPNWRTGSAHDPRRILDALAAELRDAGVVAVRGVTLDRGHFVGPARPADWPADQLRYAYCPSTGALALDDGCFRARLVAAGGATARIEILAPPVALPIEGSIALTGDRQLGGRFGLHEDRGKLVAWGHFYRGASGRVVEGSVVDPELLFARAVHEALARAGIAVRPGAPPADVAIGCYRSPLLDALDPMLKESSNFHAEQVLRVLGAETVGDGSFAGGVRAVERQLVRLTEPPPSWRMTDGSGLARTNRVTPRFLCAVLCAAAAAPWGEVLRDALPCPGEGTLDDRFRGCAVAPKVAAKSGWIAGASALSGYVGERVFSILMSYDPDRGGLNRELKALQERMVVAIDALAPQPVEHQR